MSYGVTQKLLCDDSILIESPFLETSRSGRPWRSVLLALTRDKFVIISRKKLKHNPSICYNKIESQDSLDKIQLSVFKRSHTQMLKACFSNKAVKYFELETFLKRKIFWNIWCHHIAEINRGFKVWPFSSSYLSIESKNKPQRDIDLIKAPSKNTEKNHLKWTDKYLYLGSKREAEDNERPIPIPGLGNTEELQLLYLKPEYFGCWDQAEHWVQCGESSMETACDSIVYTYTGEPTSNVTYTSLMTTTTREAWRFVKECGGVVNYCRKVIFEHLEFKNDYRKAKFK